MKITTLVTSASWKKAPSFIRTHGVFKNIKRIDKPFPEMGLPNSIEKCEVNFDGKPVHIAFSSNNIMGFWDLATMSMRGVCSCMHWENAHSRCLIGSVTDPFVGIVYVTDNTMTPYGLTMKRRSLVRLVYAPNSREYRLLVERVYKDTGNRNPTIYNNRDTNWQQTLQVFKDFLRKKVGDKYKVIDERERDHNSWGDPEDFIPGSSSLNHIGSQHWGMSDCRAAYRTFNDPFAAKFATQT